MEGKSELVGSLSLFLFCTLAAAAPLEPGPDVPSALLLQPGEIRSITLAGDINRVAVGNPEIVDVTILSANEVLLQAKKAGTTNLILWHQQERRVIAVTVQERAPDELVEQLRRVLDQLNLPDVQVKREGNKIFLIGQVPTKDDQDRIEQVLTLFPGIANVTSVKPEPPPPPAPEPPLVQLGVQVVEVSRTDLEKLGVQWSESVALTEPSSTDLTFHDALFKWGTSLTRGSVSARLNALVRQNRARLLAEPKLATVSGKSAESFLGGEVPVLSATTTGVATGTVTTNVEFKKFGVKLKMTPAVDPKGERITTKMEAEVSALDTSSAIVISGVTIPGFKIRKAESEFITSSGETIIVAGLLQSEDSRAVDQVPALGSIPVLGRLFRSPEFQKKETELVIAVTPELMVDRGKAADRSLMLDEALASSEVAAAVDDPKLRYALQVQERIARAVRYPQRERELGMEGRVNLRLHLFKDGTLGKAMVAQSSGIEALDAEALKAAETQAPFPPFPSSLAQQDLWLDLPVIFRP